MAHFAELGLDNTVKRVVVIHNNELLDGDGVEQESLGIAFCEQLFGGTWVQTSYNGNIRKNYAGVGYTYNSSLDAFIPPKPYASWTLDETTCQWEAPVAMPVDDNSYTWNETDQTWDLVGE
jgi:hypothetical protein